MAAERGARWSAGDGTELRLSDFSAKGWVAALDGGTAGFVEGWFVPPVTGDATFLLPKDTQAWLSWSGTATATQLVPLAAVPSPSVGGEPWPAWPSDNDAASDNLGAISAKLGLVKGQSYWLSLNCSAAAAASQGCALGVRLHAATAPHGLSLSGRTLTGRTEVPLCLSLTDRDACCASFERVALGTGFVNQASSGYPCIPAVSSFYASAICLSSVTSAASYPSLQAACPPRANAVGMARPRVALPSQIACSTLTDRYACANALDGRSAAAYANQPCIPARTHFVNGRVCETAGWVGSFDQSSAASSSEFAEPNVNAAHLSYAGLHHEVQRITLLQSSPNRSVQYITFAAIECDADSTTYDCIGGNQRGTVQFRHGGNLGGEVDLATGTATQIAASFLSLADGVYGGLVATVELTNRSHVVWRLELLTAWGSCTSQLLLPLLSVRCNAKVVASVARGSQGSCLSGGVRLSLPTAGSSASALLPWSATDAEAEALLAPLVPDGTGVMVHRSGDGHVSAVFTVTFLGAGDWPTLLFDDALLLRADSATKATSTTAYATVEELVPGGLDLRPLPGRYLTAPSNASVVSVRLRDKNTALCTAPNWDELHIGCFAAAELANRTSTITTWPAAMALEKCARACVGSTAFYTSGDTCGCLENKPAASTHHPAYFCKQPCSAEPSQLCGASTQVCAKELMPNNNCPPGQIILPASTYNLPLTLSTNPANGNGACSFTRSAESTPTLEAVAPRTAAFNATLELRGAGFLSSGMQVMASKDARCESWCRATAETNADGATKAWDQRCFRSSALAPDIYPCGGCAECGPTVTVCGGQACPVSFYNDTHVRCRMPMCAASSNESTLVHVLTLGYAAAPNSTSVAGVLSLASVATDTSSIGNNVAAGSAAGGVVLTLSGEGFEDDATRMQVLLRTSGGSALASCVVISSSSSLGILTCRTQQSVSPLTNAGTLCDVRVSALSAAGDVASTRDTVGGFQMLSSDTSPLVEAQSTAGGSELGGAALCLYGQRLNGSSAAVTIGGVACPLLSANETAVCCATPASAQGVTVALSVTISVPEVGDALFAPGAAGTFTYAAAPTVVSVSPAAGHVGSTVHVQGSGFTGVPEVTLGGVACVVVVASSDSINCTVGDASLGALLSVVVSVAGVGLAAVSSGVTFTQQTSITAIAPTSGSAGGGTPLTLTGFGFGRLSAPSVSVGSQLCAVLSQNATHIVCSVPAAVAQASGMEVWVNSFYPDPPTTPPPSLPPSPPPSPPPAPPPPALLTGLPLALTSGGRISSSISPPSPLDLPSIP